MRKLVMAVRPGALSIAQARIVQEKLKALGVETERLLVKTKGDVDRKSPLRKIGGDGLFVRGVEAAVLAGEADFAIHCGKDLPYKLAEGLCIAGVVDAADPRDVLLLRKDRSKRNSLVIGTGSPRRMAEFALLDGKARFADIRGNVTTRMEKLLRGDYDGIILAKAGLDRLGVDLGAFEVRVLEPDEMLPAVAQGLLVAECREGDGEVRECLRGILDVEGEIRFGLERGVFGRLGGGDCAGVVGVFGEIDGDGMRLRVLFGDRRVEVSGRLDEGDRLIEEVCAQLVL